MGEECEAGRSLGQPVRWAGQHSALPASLCPTGRGPVGLATPHHCPPAALPGPRWRAALSPHTHICGPGWHLPWLPPRSGACWPAPWGDPTPRWPAVLCMFTDAAGLGSGCFLGLQAPPPHPAPSWVRAGRGGGPSPQSPRQPRGLQGAWRRVGSRLSLLCLVPLMMIPLATGPRCPGLPHLPITSRLAFYPRGSWPLKGQKSQV